MTIEEKIKIMLKGALGYSEIVEIKHKLETNEPLRVKLGLDPSAPDIHLGHAVVLRKMKQLQDIGCEILIIIGDFTGMIGDPTGKSKVRKQLSKDEVIKNARTYQKQIFKILDEKHTTIYFNSQWLSKMNFSDVITLSSKSTVARMLERKDFAKRYKEQKPIAVHEFLYPLMQAYDSVAVKADIEIGGTDQTFNILMGRKIQREYGQEPQLTIFMPLLEGTDGHEKMSKSLGNYIGINENANIMYEKVMKIPDNLIIKYYELCTDVHPDNILKINDDIIAGKNPRDIKMDLAKEIVSLYHSQEEVIEAIEHFNKAYHEKIAPNDVPTIEIDLSAQNTTIGEQIINELVAKGHYRSKGEIRRLFQQNAVSLNDNKINNPSDIIEINNNDIIKIGKGKYYKIISL